MLRDRNTVVKNPFKRPFVARFVKFHPVSWYGHISMRVELYGSLVGKLLFIVIPIAFGRRKRCLINDHNFHEILSILSNPSRPTPCQLSFLLHIC